MRLRYAFLAAMWALTASGCSSPISSAPPASDGAEAVVRLPAEAVQVGASARADKKSIFHKKSKSMCDPDGSTLAIPAVSRGGLTLSGSIEYGTNQCTKRERFLQISTVATGDPYCSVESGFTFGGVSDEVVINGAPLTFSGSGLTGTITSNVLVDSIDYTLFLIAGSSVLFQEDVGKPSKQTVVFPSPFQNEFAFPSGGAVPVIYLCYKT